MTRKRTCVIFGGSGFVGRAIIGQLREMGFSIVVPTRNRELVHGLTVVPEVRVVTADIYDPATLRKLLDDADVAINLVGILNEKGHHRGRGFYTAHRDLTGAIVEACVDAGVPRFLQMSALKANAKDGPSDYLKSKGEAEALVRKAPAGLAWTIFQPSVVFGPEDSFINRFAQLLKLSPVLPLARPIARFAPVYVGDVAEAFCSSIDKAATHGQTYQLCGPRVYSLRELVTYVRDQLGLKRMIVGLPDPLAKLQARIFDFVPGKPLSTDNLRSLMVHSICDSDGLAELGIEATPLEGIVPMYLSREGRAAGYDRMRKSARLGD